MQSHAASTISSNGAITGAVIAGVILSYVSVAALFAVYLHKNVYSQAIGYSTLVFLPDSLNENKATKYTIAVMVPAAIWPVSFITILGTMLIATISSSAQEKREAQKQKRLSAEKDKDLEAQLQSAIATVEASLPKESLPVASVPSTWLWATKA